MAGELVELATGAEPSVGFLLKLQTLKELQGEFKPWQSLLDPAKRAPVWT